MKAVFLAVALALALFASTGSALAQSEERSLTQSDSFTFEGGGLSSEREGAWRACTEQEWSAAAYHCYRNHTNYFAVCNLTSCTAQGGRIAYSWSGTTFGLFG